MAIAVRVWLKSKVKERLRPVAVAMSRQVSRS